MSELTLKPATRQGINPTIGLYSESGCGKTYTSLLLARGIAGPTGEIVMVDSENGRGSLYADVPIFGGYKVANLTEYSPARYAAAIDLIESSGAAVGIIDSGSHEWEGTGGILDMAATNEEESKRPGLHNWKKPKFEHAKFVQRLMRCKVPLIICLRAKFKTRQGKDERGKTVIIKDDHTSPIQAEDFLFELTAHGEILPDHSLRLTKWSHPGLKACFPEDKPVEIRHGQLIAQWCASPGIGSPTGSTSNPSTVATVGTLKKQLWSLLKSKLGEAMTVEQAQQFLWDETLMNDGEHMTTASADVLAKTIDKAQAKLNGGAK